MKTPTPPPPARRYTSPTGRILIPILFVVLLIVILGRPILVQGLNLDEDEPEPVPTRTGDDDPEDVEFGPSRLAFPYPRNCFRDAARQGIGLVAASSGSIVTARTPTGQSAFALRAQEPVGFSPSGRFLATAGADLWTDAGNHVGLAFSRPVQKWAWSPVGDCVVGIENERLSVVQPRERAKVLLRGVPITTFSFSPDGSRIVFAIDRRDRSAGIWMADLRTGDVKILQASVGWVLMGWSRATRPILFQEGTHGDPPSREGLSFQPSDVISDCGNDFVMVSSDRLATLGVAGAPDYIPADRRFRYTAVSCAPNGRLLVAVRYPKGSPQATSLAVLRPDGVYLRDVDRGSAVEDHPMWGDAGVVFVGSAAGGDSTPLVWFVPEGGAARLTGLRAESFGDELDALVDWSATPPIGHPTD